MINSLIDLYLNHEQENVLIIAEVNENFANFKYLLPHIIFHFMLQETFNFKKSRWGITRLICFQFFLTLLKVANKVIL